MKKAIDFSLLFLVMITFSCKNGGQNKVEPNQFSEKVLDIASQKIIDDLRAQGMTINAGTEEPLVKGVFQTNSLVFVKDWAASTPSRVGTKAAETKLQVVSFDTFDSTDHEAVDLYFKQATSSGFALWKGKVSGSGNKFTAFTEDLVQYSGLTSVMLVIAISGEVTSEGIKDYQFAQYVKEIRNDPNKLFSVGSTVILKEEDGFAEKTSVF
ncbi:hypothetical protein [Persicitalea jodogahamensis]|uniref:Lipoprotein n=1 Tax=Persicitalea jodogahamensis TaxID=402147 RepID=A0A8J3D429_9BACT|nr:hypothetical protein [Persicitalea jodogahamensis]GHB71673.1 hypothetical protein GCM10007390_26920 [Persicitalea jodogahamensis]